MYNRLDGQSIVASYQLLQFCTMQSAFGHLTDTILVMLRAGQIHHACLRYIRTIITKELIQQNYNHPPAA